MKIKCPNPNCRGKENIFPDRMAYAKHILDCHKDDEVATEWANTTLRLAKQEEQGQATIENNPPGKSTYLGKRLDRIPPKRFGSLPDFIKKLLGIQKEERSSE